MNRISPVRLVNPVLLGDPPLKIIAQRDGDSVSGRVEFPYAAHGQTSVPISYDSRRPDPLQSSADSQPSSDVASLRFAQVKRIHAQQSQYPDKPKAEILREIVEAAKASGAFQRISVRTLQNWERKFDLEGIAGLADQYTPVPHKVLPVNAQDATAAIQICAWWAFRIGSVSAIDGKMMYAAAGLVRSGYPLADVLATIDCYYAWPCDRLHMPFKPFSRWVRYDFEKWLFRACDENDYRRSCAQVHPNPLRGPANFRHPAVADPKTRRREVLHAPSRRAISALAPPATSLVAPPVVSEPSLDAQPQAAVCPSVPVTVCPPFPSSPWPQVADSVIESRSRGSLAEALLGLPDAYRVMLLKAARGDHAARAQALATLPLWWDSLPEPVRHNLDAKASAWSAEHPYAVDKQVTARKLSMLFPMVRARNSGARRLGAALRISQAVSSL